MEPCESNGGAWFNNLERWMGQWTAKIRSYKGAHLQIGLYNEAYSPLLKGGGVRELISNQESWVRLIAIAYYCSPAAVRAL